MHKIPPTYRRVHKATSAELLIELTRPARQGVKTIILIELTTRLEDREIIDG